MSTDWFYMSSGWFHKAKRVGPISEQELLSCIDTGKIQPETLVQSHKTRQRWVPMSTVGPAMARWLKAHPDADEQAS